MVLMQRSVMETNGDSGDGEGYGSSSSCRDGNSWDESVPPSVGVKCLERWVAGCLGCGFGGLAKYGAMPDRRDGGWALCLADDCDRLSAFGGVEAVLSRVGRLTAPSW